MKSLLTIGMIIGVTAVSTLLLASVGHEPQKGCANKIHHIKQEIVKAQEMKNDHRVNGLEISLSNVQANCTEEGLMQRLEAKIDDEREDLREHTQDLEQAVADDRVDKVEKYKAKIAKDQTKIDKLTEQLDALS